VMEMMGNIRVICRIRPVLKTDGNSEQNVVVTHFPSDQELALKKKNDKGEITTNRFEFDRVFNMQSNQQEVFDAVEPMVVSAMDGYKVCIFAYGQTGSGKTYTMEGEPNDRGITFRGLQEVFKIVETRKENWDYTLQMSMLEIYNESVRDLLALPPKKAGGKVEHTALEVRQSPSGSVVPGLCEVEVTSMVHVEKLMAKGNSHRAVGVHDMNSHSSRSHSIICITCPCSNKHNGKSYRGKLHLIDLAGSERVGKTGCSGERLKEAQNINRSLSAFGDVIAALGTASSSRGGKKPHIPYRNSKLTFLLQDSLGGQSKVLMFVNASPSLYNASETLCSLQFAARCRNTELGTASKVSKKKRTV